MLNVFWAARSSRPPPPWNLMFLPGPRHVNIELGGRGDGQQHTNDNNSHFGCNLLSITGTPHMCKMDRLMFLNLPCLVQSLLFYSVVACSVRFCSVLFCSGSWRLGAFATMATPGNLGAVCQKTSKRLWAVHASSQNVLTTGRGI